MALLKQKTVRVGNQQQTVGLKKLQNDMGRGGEHKYEIVDLDTQSLLEDPLTDKREAKRKFKATVEDIERGMEAYQDDRNGGLDMGLGSTKDMHDPFEDDGLL